jgi:hypothetical protein
MANRPNQRVCIPAARHHRFNSIGLKSPVKDTNSVAMPWVDMTEDVRLIREGHGTRLPNDRWSINSRTYVRESGKTGIMYPELGDGVVVLTREQYRALTILRGIIQLRWPSSGCRRKSQSRTLIFRSHET